jgi:hypothetical protein
VYEIVSTVDRVSDSVIELPGQPKFAELLQKPARRQLFEPRKLVWKRRVDVDTAGRELRMEKSSCL